MQQHTLSIAFCARVSSFLNKNIEAIKQRDELKSLMSGDEIQSLAAIENCFITFNCFDILFFN